jgi:hypothetical protein
LIAESRPLHGSDGSSSSSSSSMQQRAGLEWMTRPLLCCCVNVEGVDRRHPGRPVEVGV